VVEEEERIERLAIAEAEGPPQVNAGGFECGSGLAVLLDGTDRHGHLLGGGKLLREEYGKAVKRGRTMTREAWKKIDALRPFQAAGNGVAMVSRDIRCRAGPRAAFRRSAAGGS